MANDDDEDDDENKEEKESEIFEPYYDQPLVFTGVDVLPARPGDPYTFENAAIYEPPISPTKQQHTMSSTSPQLEPSQYSHLHDDKHPSEQYENSRHAIELRSRPNLADDQDNTYSHLDHNNNITESSVDVTYSILDHGVSSVTASDDHQYSRLSRATSDDDIEPDNETYARLTARSGSMSFERKSELYNKLQPPPGKYENIGDSTIPENDEFI